MNITHLSNLIPKLTESQKILFNANQKDPVEQMRLLQTFSDRLINEENKALARQRQIFAISNKIPWEV